RIGRKRIFAGEQSRSAYVFSRNAQLMTEGLRNCVQYTNGFFGYFRTDTITGEGSNIQNHVFCSMVLRKCAGRPGAKPYFNLCRHVISALYAPQVIFLIAMMLG